MTRSTHQNTQAFRAGAWLGRARRALGRRENDLVHWLVGRGCPSAVASGLIWIVSVSFLGLLLAVAVFIVAARAVSKIASHADLSKGYEEPEWRFGLLGFGQYDRDGSRVDPHDPNDPHAER